VPLLEPKVIVGKNGRRVVIYIVEDSDSDSYDSDYSIGPYSPDSDSDSDLEELVY
jgi:hypothetical protein